MLHTNDTFMGLDKRIMYDDEYAWPDTREDGTEEEKAERGILGEGGKWNAEIRDFVEKKNVSNKATYWNDKQAMRLVVNEEYNPLIEDNMNDPNFMNKVFKMTNPKTAVVKNWYNVVYNKVVASGNGKVGDDWQFKGFCLEMGSFMKAHKTCTKNC